MIPTTSLIVIAYNGRHLLKNCLDSLCDQSIPRENYEVIVVDNNSSDGTVEYVSRDYPGIRVVALEKNLGFYGAFNYAAEQIASSEFMVAIPQDTVAHRSWIEQLVLAMEANPMAMAALSNSIQPDSPDYHRFDRIRQPEFLHLAATTRLGFVSPERRVFAPEVQHMMSVAGTSVLIRRSLKDISGYYFDTTMSHFSGDVEIGIRINALGYQVILVPSAVVFHFEHGRSWLNRKELIRCLEGARDNICCWFKNMNLAEFLTFLPFLLLGTPVKATALRMPAVKRAVLFSIALFSSPLALLMAASQIPKLWKSRKDLLQRRTTPYFWLLCGLWERRLQ